MLEWDVEISEAKKNWERSQLNGLLERLRYLGYESPSQIEPSEKPDFIVTLAGEQVGIEITTAVYEEYVRATVIHHKEIPDQCIVTTHLKDRIPRRSNTEIRAELLDVGSEWKSVDQEMLDWRDKVARAWEQKEARLAASDFSLFSRNWLLIQDEPGLPNDVVTFHSACRHAASIFSSAHRTRRSFDAVFLLSDCYLFRWNGRTLDLSYAYSRPRKE